MVVFGPDEHGTGPVRFGSMEQDTTVTVGTDEVEVEDELLVEEISIDGMCGVY